MKRVGKGFSGAVTPLFPTMMVQAQEEMGEGSAMPTDPHHTPIIQPSTSQPQKKQSRRKQRKDTEIPSSPHETTKTALAKGDASLKKKSSKQERKRKSKTYEEKIIQECKESIDGEIDEMNKMEYMESALVYWHVEVYLSYQVLFTA
ncbi:hypothetical protein Tco_1311854 [Tanacetum coccineum]